MKRIVIVVAFVLFWSVPGKAQFGGIVFDPSNFGEAVTEAGYDFSNLQQAIQTYTQIANQYQQWQQAMQTLVNMPQRYLAQFSQWQNLKNVSDLYGNTTPWVNSANNGSGASSSYGGVITALMKYPSSWTSTLSPTSTARMTAQAGTVQIRDGSNTSALETIGQVRNDSSQITSSLGNLQTDTFADDPLNGSMVPVLQKTGSAAVLQVQSQQDTNQLLELILEKQMLDSTDKRTADANAVASDVSLKTNLSSTTSASNQGLTSALSSWQLQ